VRRLFRRLVLFGALGAGVALLLPSTVWVDAEGNTYLTDGDEPPSPGARPVPADRVSEQWGGSVLGEPVRASAASTAEDRFERELRAAREDLARGERTQGLQRLRRLYADHPERPEAAWLLVQTERGRGRLEAAREVLEATLATASAQVGPWPELMKAELREVRAELELAGAGSEGFWDEEFASENFRIHYDHRFAVRDYGERVAGLLEEARSQVETVMGRALPHPLDVHLYTKGHYLESYEHRFGFATVGFYDGAIHVVAARHPRGELAALLVHEYSHAVFRAVLRSDQPFFLNEGIADGQEERTRGRPGLSRGEWRQLLDAHRDDEEWIPLESIVISFAGLAGKRALLAYLESRAAVELIEERSPGAVARWLTRCERGEPWERALEAETGWDVPALDTALRRSVADRFPRDPLTEVVTRRSG
jgi:hypothetical protein